MYSVVIDHIAFEEGTERPVIQKKRDLRCVVPGARGKARMLHSFVPNYRKVCHEVHS